MTIYIYTRLPNRHLKFMLISVAILVHKTDPLSILVDQTGLSTVAELAPHKDMLALHHCSHDQQWYLWNKALRALQLLPGHLQGTELELDLDSGGYAYVFSSALEEPVAEKATLSWARPVAENQCSKTISNIAWHVHT